jgi:hypothetical protein
VVASDSASYKGFDAMVTENQVGLFDLGLFRVVEGLSNQLSPNKVSRGFGITDLVLEVVLGL